MTRPRLRRGLIGGFALLVVFLFPGLSRGADHEDSPSVLADPTSDFGDVLAWMSPDADKLNLVGTVVRRATAESRFSDSVQYVFHTTSRSAFGEPASEEVNIICTFEGTDQQTVSCWAGDDSYVTGDASDPNGIVSDDGDLRVFAGLRNDAFFFNSSGFNATRAAVRMAAPSLTFDAAGCPAVDEATSDTLVTLLMSSVPSGGGEPGPAVDAFANANILVLALQVDKSIVTGNGPIVSVWGSTNRR
jgi:hypothetical protein